MACTGEREYKTMNVESLCEERSKRAVMNDSDYASRRSVVQAATGSFSSTTTFSFSFSSLTGPGGGLLSPDNLLAVDPDELVLLTAVGVDVEEPRLERAAVDR